MDRSRHAGRDEMVTYPPSILHKYYKQNNAKFQEKIQKMLIF